MSLRWTRSVVFLKQNGILSSFMSPFIERASLQLYCTESKQEGDAGGKAKKSKESEKVVLLHNHDGKVIGSRSLTVALEIAKKQKMGLMQIPSTTTNKDWYKIVPMKQVAKDERKSHAEVKDMNIGVSIADHDLETKMKRVTKWIAEGYVVRIVILGDPGTPTEQLAKTRQRLKNLIADVPHEYSEPRAAQGVIKCSIKPLKKPKKSGESEESRPEEGVPSMQ